MSCFSKPVYIIGSVAAAAVMMGTAPAQAAIVHDGAIYTERNDREGEPTHKEILEHLYGGTFVSAGDHGLDFTNGVIYVKRIADDRDTPAQTAIGQTNGDLTQYTDRFWQDQFSTVYARARFADYGQAFGYVPTDDNDDYVQLFSAYHDRQYNMPQSATMDDLNGDTFVWARSGDNGVWSSNPEQNRDGEDHLITYKVVVLEPRNGIVENGQLQDLLEYKTFLLFWEDQTFEDQNVNSYDIGDWDYNDLVVEIRAQYNDIPEPGAALAGMGLLAMLGMRRRHA